ncbi:MAG: transglycosylase domain-containing protein [Candidatus Niyogibacteria bacterium]|nr:MAG: transglycosylase domain-containing protein [Candidatus Niyogibacteria bacterium]
MAGKRNLLKKTKKIFFYGIAAAVLFVGSLSVWALTLDIPDFEAFDQRKVVQSTKIYDRSGDILLYDIHNDIRRTVVAFGEIPPGVKNATVAMEDSNFYNHYGISFLAIMRAAFVDVIYGGVHQGGSTITQQLVKKALLTDEQTITRKLKELVLALKVERAFSKEQILGFYLNEIPYGSSAYGIAAAAETFFGKKLRDITLAESTYLASLPNAPTFYSPYGPHQKELNERKNLVLKRMLDLGFITQDEADKAEREEVKFIPRGNETLKAPHFIFYVRDYLTEKYGEEAVESGGLKVVTTLDWNLQQKAEDLTEKFVEDEEEKFNVYNAGLIATDPQTGQILVMVGSKDWFSEPKPEGCSPGLNCKFEPHVNVTAYASGRQPGSAFKPFVYATAFQKGFTPETAVFDLPTEFNPSCDPDAAKALAREEEQNEEKKDNCYHPRNYDGVFRGPIILREALAQSINLPAVKTLYLAGLSESLKTAKKLGITTLNDPDRYGLTLVLGGGEVKLLEMVGAYGVFANDGVRNPLTSILKVEDAKGNILEEFQPKPEEVLDKQTARLINDVLSDNEARTPAFGAASPLYFPGWDVAAKTGTTNDSRDAWVVGYTPNLAWGVWFGNNDNSEMVKSIAGFIAAPLWNAFFQEASRTLEKKEFISPAPTEPKKAVLNGGWRGSRTYTIDKISKKLATAFTPQQYKEEKPLIQIHSILYWLDKNNPDGPIPQNPSDDSQFSLWEYPVRKWAESKNLREESESDIPTQYDDVHLPQYAPEISFVVSPPDESTYSGSISFTLSASSRYPISQMDVIFGNRFIGSIKNAPYSFSIDLAKIKDLRPEETLVINVYDSVGNSSSLEKTIRLR